MNLPPYSTSLPAYSNDNACPKCGADEATTEWCPGLLTLKARSGGTNRFPKTLCHEMWGDAKWGGSAFERLGPDHLHRYCTRCKYSWVEAPLDRQPALTQLANAAGPQ